MAYGIEWVKTQLIGVRNRRDHRRLLRAIDAMPDWQKKDIGWPVDEGGSDSGSSQQNDFQARQDWPGDFRLH
ncbi:hypothetical protein [Notoacmeibacter marinus]|uniref:hypothetical protein n=1 Tax=Notoacmeibacter marinus TaxID=1876515 RepID=UPI000DF4A20B|nr:hypothetical protein [Notoacmeibacter marinus]